MHWRVVGRIAGPRLPSRTRSIGEFTFGPLPSTVQPLDRVTGLKATPGSDTHYVGHAGDLRVASPMYFWIDIEAPSATEAITDVVANWLPQLQTALSVRIDRVPYMVEVLWATDGNKNEGNWSTTVSTAFWHPEELSISHLRLITRDYNTISTDEIACTAAKLYASAIYQEVTSGDPMSRQAAYLTYFKVIELIANLLGPANPSSRKEDEQEILQQLQKKLESRKGVRSKVGAVRDADVQLSRISGRYLTLRIEATAQHLGMPREWREQATRFSKLRNTQLGHVSELRDVSEPPDFSPRQLARQILEAYIDFKSQR